MPSKNIENGIDEQSLEVESFEEQGPIAYKGDEKHQNINLGNYIGLTYYSQIDSRWAFIHIHQLIKLHKRFKQVDVDTMC